MTCTGTSCNQGREPCRDGCDKPRRTCAELGVCRGRTPPCSEGCLPILRQRNSDGSDPHAETKDLIDMALDALLVVLLLAVLTFTIFAAIGFWSAR